MATAKSSEFFGTIFFSSIQKERDTHVFLYSHLEVAVVPAVLIFIAVLMLFAIPNPTIIRPRITPVIGPGNTIIEKFLVAIIAFTARIVPPISSRTDIRTDFWPHDTPNAAAASSSPVTGKISPLPVGGRRPPKVLIRKIRNEMVAAMASP
jgi:hypothetical protein